MKYCCETMDVCVNDPRVDVKYNPIWRSYYIPLKKKFAVQILFYCPWCGIKLPKDLREEYYAIIYDELKLHPEFDVLTTPGLPEEFKSDAWWKKRGL